MSYEAMAQIANDPLLRGRIVACLAVENAASTDHPESTADVLKWKLAATDGWAVAYGAAMVEEGRTVPPGADPNVISDAMIRDAVRTNLNIA